MADYTVYSSVYPTWMPPIDIYARGIHRIDTGDITYRSKEVFPEG